MTLPIFLLGLIVTGITIAAVLVVGVDEAGDPNHARDADLTPLERALVNRPATDDSQSSEDD
jgi:hypothetical protein